jgi:hypothetical protein
MMVPVSPEPENRSTACRQEFDTKLGGLMLK